MYFAIRRKYYRQLIPIIPMQFIAVGCVEGCLGHGVCGCLRMTPHFTCFNKIIYVSKTFLKTIFQNIFQKHLSKTWCLRMFQRGEGWETLYLPTVGTFSRPAPRQNISAPSKNVLTAGEVKRCFWKCSNGGKVRKRRTPPPSEHFKNTRKHGFTFPPLEHFFWHFRTPAVRTFRRNRKTTLQSSPR